MTFLEGNPKRLANFSQNLAKDLSFRTSRVPPRTQNPFSEVPYDIFVPRKRKNYAAGMNDREGRLSARLPRHVQHGGHGHATAGPSNCAATRDHPFTRGFLCQKVTRYLDRVYHPDGLLYPLKRVGRRAQGSFERITWDEAIDAIAARFAEIAASADGPQAILPYSYAGTMGKLQARSLDRRFFHRLGASLLDRTICATAGRGRLRHHARHPRRRSIPRPSIECRYIINWGSNTSVTNMHLWTLDAPRPARPARRSSPSTPTAAQTAAKSRLVDCRSAPAPTPPSRSA